MYECDNERRKNNFLKQTTESQRLSDQTYTAERDRIVCVYESFASC